jgi:hypothetical protein
MTGTENLYPTHAYKIWYADAPDELYVGSTKERLSRRMTAHRAAARKGEPPLIYQTMRAKGVNNFEYRLLGTCMVRNMDEQRMYEQSWMDRLNPTLNMCMAHVSAEQRIQKMNDYNKEYQQRPEYRQKMKEYNKKYKQRPENKQKMKQYQQRPENRQRAKEYCQRKHHCEYCDTLLVMAGIKYHCGTRKHKDNYKSLFKDVFEMDISDKEVPKWL